MCQIEKIQKDYTIKENKILFPKIFKRKPLNPNDEEFKFTSVHTDFSKTISWCSLHTFFVAVEFTICIKRVNFITGAGMINFIFDFCTT